MKVSDFLRSRTATLLGFFLLLVPGMLHAYLLMPFPGSQDLEAMRVAYLLEHTLWFTRIAGLLLLIVPVYRIFISGRIIKQIATLLVLAICGGIFYMTDVHFSAEKMFREPVTREFLSGRDTKLDGDRVVVGIEHNGVAKAYPINFIGYHHKVQDTVGGLPVLVTYCTMCRTARVYSPIVDGKHQEFRLVGARHYNAIIEDQSTGSWWYQESGEAGAGPLKGSHLQDIPYEQVTLRTWIEHHPNTLILQPDTEFADEYADLEGYDRTQRIQKDSSGSIPSWQRRNWVVGVSIAGEARAYDWNDLVGRRVINDSIGGTAIVLAVEDDMSSFHVWDRVVAGRVLSFTLDSTNHRLTDAETGSTWDWKGEAVSGTMRGTKLGLIQASQEYWHSWQNFHKNTARWKIQPL